MFWFSTIFPFDLFSKETANLIDAAAKGATDAIFVVFAVVASLIAFLSLLHFINAVIAYLGGLVNIEDLSIDASIIFTSTVVHYNKLPRKSEKKNPLIIFIRYLRTIKGVDNYSKMSSNK